MEKYLHDVFSPFTSIRLVVVVGAVEVVDVRLLHLLAALKLNKCDSSQ